MVRINSGVPQDFWSNPAAPASRARSVYWVESAPVIKSTGIPLAPPMRRSHSTVEKTSRKTPAALEISGGKLMSNRMRSGFASRRSPVATDTCWAVRTSKPAFWSFIDIPLRNTGLSSTNRIFFGLIQARKQHLTCLALRRLRSHLPGWMSSNGWGFIPIVVIVWPNSTRTFQP